MVYLGQALGLVGIAICVLYSFLSYRKYKYPTGPQALPLIGNYFSLAKLQANPEKELVRLKNKYGELCMLWFGRNPVIILSSPRIAKELMDKVNFMVLPLREDTELIAIDPAWINILFPTHPEYFSRDGLAVEAGYGSNRRDLPVDTQDLP
jgi:hypothetical protein